MNLRAQVLAAGARQSKEVGGFNVYELTGADRVAVIELINELGKNEAHRMRSHFYVKLFVISHSLLDEKGEKIFNVHNDTDRKELQALNVDFLENIFKTASELSGLEFLAGKPAKKD